MPFHVQEYFLTRPQCDAWTFSQQDVASFLHWRCACIGVRQLRNAVYHFIKSLCLRYRWCCMCWACRGVPAQCAFQQSYNPFVRQKFNSFFQHWEISFIARVSLNLLHILNAIVSVCCSSKPFETWSAQALICMGDFAGKLLGQYFSGGASRAALIGSDIV